MPDLPHHAEIAELLNRFPEVRWDRLIDDDHHVEIYGWLDRPCEACPTEKGIVVSDCEICRGSGVDRRADFLLFSVEVTGEKLEVTYTTSSAELSGDFGRRLWGEDEDGEHIDCQRVEEIFGELVANAIRL